MQPSSRHTYKDAGFNTFMIRSLKSNSSAESLSDGISTGSSSISFDRQSIEGAIGDILAIGKRLTLNGVLGRMIVKDETGTTENGWVGDLRE